MRRSVRGLPPRISPLVCPLIGTSQRILLHAGSRIERIHGVEEIEETYRCSYGLNPNLDLLPGSALRITGRGVQGEARVSELATHPLYLATLYQPERNGLRGQAHPLIGAFLSAASGRTKRGSC